jgi:hypothetical protein
LGAAWAQWDEVRPEFIDDLNDAARRDHAGYNNQRRYRNDSGRNDLARLRLACDRENVYFYAETQAPLSPWTEPHWMELYLDLDGRHDTGWEGYDVVVNRVVKAAETTTLQRWSGTSWEVAADLRLRIEANRLMLAVPRRLLGHGVCGERRCRPQWPFQLPLPEPVGSRDRGTAVTLSEVATTVLARVLRRGARLQERPRRATLQPAVRAPRSFNEALRTALNRG